jgi:hypothetical protein
VSPVDWKESHHSNPSHALFMRPIVCDWWFLAFLIARVLVGQTPCAPSGWVKAKSEEKGKKDKEKEKNKRLFESLKSCA